MHCFAARRISTPLDTRLVNRAESRDTTEVSRNVIPLYPPSKGEHARSAESRDTTEVSRNVIPLIPLRRGKHARSVNREYYSFMNFTTQALLLL